MTIELNSLSKTVKSFKYTTVVSNGNFTSTTGWTGTDSTISTSNNILTITGTGTSGAVVCAQSTSSALASNKKFYISAKLKVTNSNCTGIFIRANGTTTGSILTVNNFNNPVINTEYTLSGIYTVTTQTGNLLVQARHSYADAATALNKQMEVREFYAIDLTDLYGSGREPVLADCRNIFKFVETRNQPSLSKTLAV